MYIAGMQEVRFMIIENMSIQRRATAGAMLSATNHRGHEAGLGEETERGRKQAHKATLLPGGVTGRLGQPGCHLKGQEK